MRANDENKTEKAWPPVWLPVIAVLCVSLVWPFIGYGALNALKNSKNRIEDWLPASFPETQSLYRFFNRFGSDEFLMISWEGCILGDPRIELVREQLTAPDEEGVVYFDKADGGTNILAALTERRTMSEADARRRMAKSFIGPDGKQTCVVALVSKDGFDDRSAAIKRAWVATQQATGLSIEEIHIAGTTADSVAVDEASNQWLLELNLFSMLVCLAILGFSLRKFWLIGILFLSAIFNQQLALAFIYFSGGHVDSVQLLVANLSFVLSISAGLHYLGYFRDAVRHGARSPALQALRQSAIPSILASVTTSLGFLSLCTSVIVPIKSFGLYAAILVPLNTVIVVGSLAVHATWASRRDWRLRLVEDSLADRVRPSGQRISLWESAMLPVLGRNPLIIVLVAISLILVFGMGITKLQTSVGTHKMLAENAKLVRDYAWLEQHIGPLVPIELVLHFPKLPEHDSVSSLKRLEALERMRTALTPYLKFRALFQR